MKTNGRCRVHGGSSPKGLLSPSWRTGRFSKYLPPALAGVVAEMATDRDRGSMTEELALLDARIAQVLARLGTAENAATWSGLEGALKDFHRAQVTGDPRTRPARMHAALERVGSLVTTGAGEGAAWREVLDLIDRRRVLVESEERRAAAAGRLVPAEQVLNLLAAVSRLVLDEVSDPDARRRVNERLMALAHGHRLAIPQLRAIEGAPSGGRMAE